MKIHQILNKNTIIFSLFKIMFTPDEATVYLKHVLYNNKVVKDFNIFVRFCMGFKNKSPI